MSDTSDMVWLQGGRFRMGSNAHHAGEAPAHAVEVSGFSVDAIPVTNRHGKPVDPSTSHIGFRCVRRP